MQVKGRSRAPSAKAHDQTEPRDKCEIRRREDPLSSSARSLRIACTLAREESARCVRAHPKFGVNNKQGDETRACKCAPLSSIRVLSLLYVIDRVDTVPLQYARATVIPHYQ